MLYMLFTCFNSKCVTPTRRRPRVTRLPALPAEAGKNSVFAPEPVCDEIPAEKLAFVEVEDRVEVVGGNFLFNCAVLCENQGLSLPQIVTGGQGGWGTP